MNTLTKLCKIVPGLLLAAVCFVLFSHGAPCDGGARTHGSALAYVEAERLEKVELMLRQWLLTNSGDRGARQQHADVLSRQGRFDEALAEYDVLLEDDPWNPALIIDKADVLCAQNRYPQALLLLRKIRRLGPEYEEVYRARQKEWTRLKEQGEVSGDIEPLSEGKPLLPSLTRPASAKDTTPGVGADVEALLLTAAESIRDGDLPKAVDLYEQVLALKPGMQGAQVSLLEVLYRLGQHEKLIELGMQILEARPGDKEVLVLLARNAGILERTDECVEFYRRACTADPDDSALAESLVYALDRQARQQDLERKHIMDRAVYLSRSQRMEEARDLYMSILEKDGKNVRALVGLADLALEEKRLDGALELYHKALSVQEWYLPAEMGIIRVKSLMGHHREALDLAVDLSSRLKKTADARRIIAGVIQQMDNCEESITYFSSVLERESENLVAVHGLAMAYKVTGRYLDAIEVNEHILELDPGNVDVLVDLGILCNYTDNNRSALRFMVQARRLSPHRGDVRAMLFQLRSWFSRVDADLRQGQKVLALADGDVGEYISLGRVSNWQKNRDTTIRLYEDTLVDDSENTIALLGLGNTYLYDKHWSEAERYFSRVLEISPGNREALEGLEKVQRSRSTEFDLRYGAWELKGFNPQRNAFDRVRNGMEKTLKYSRTLPSGRQVHLKYHRREEYEVYLPLQRLEYRLERDTMSLGLRWKEKSGVFWDVQADLNTLKSMGDNRYDMADTVNMQSGYLVVGKEYYSKLYTAAVSRNLIAEPVPYTSNLEVNARDSYFLACDADVRHDLSLLFSAAHHTRTISLDERDQFRLKARFRPGKQENIQLSGIVGTVTNPRTRQLGLALDLRDISQNKMRYHFGYGVLLETSDGQDTEIHNIGVLLDYNLSRRLCWYFDGDYIFERTTDQDRYTGYQTGLRFNILR